MMKKHFYWLLGALLFVLLLTVVLIWRHPESPAGLRRLDDGVVLRKLHAEAVMALRFGQHRRAAVSLRELMRRSPENVVVRQMLGRLLYQTGRFESASLVFRDILARFPENCAARNNLGQVLIARHAVEAGSRQLKEALRGGDPGGFIEYNLAQACAALGDEKAVEEHWRNALGSIAQEDYPPPDLIAVRRSAWRLPQVVRSKKVEL